MANTIKIVDNLHRGYQSQIESKTVAYPLVNKTLQKDLARQGDTVVVKYVDNIELDTAASSGLAISATDYIEKTDTLVVDQVRNKNFPILDIERIRNDVSEQEKMVEIISKAAARNLDKYALAVAVAGAGTTINSVTPATITDTTIIAEIEAMRIAHDELGLERDNDQYLFLDAQRASNLRMSGRFDGISEGFTAREKAYVGMWAGYKIYQTNHIPLADSDVNTFMVALDTESVHGAEQMSKFKLTTATNAMADSLLFENVYGMDVVGNNTSRIVVNKIVK